LEKRGGPYARKESRTSPSTLLFELGRALSSLGTDEPSPGKFEGKAATSDPLGPNQSKGTSDWPEERKDERGRHPLVSNVSLKEKVGISLGTRKT